MVHAVWCSGMALAHTESDDKKIWYNNIDYLSPIVYYPMSKKKTGHLIFAHNFTKYWPSFQILLSSDSAVNMMKQPLKNPPHLKRVATLPCEMKMSGKLLTIWNKGIV